MKELLEEKKSSSDKVKEKEKKIKEQTDTISSIKQQYSKSTVVNKDGYCYIGTDENMRQCVV